MVVPMKVFLKNILLLIGICLLVIDYIESGERSCFRSRTGRIFEIVGENILIQNCFLGHDDLRAFGLVSKSNDKILRTTAERRKEYLLLLIPNLFRSEGKINDVGWDSYGDIVYYREVKEGDTLGSVRTHKTLRIHRFQLLGQGKIRRWSNHWSDFYRELEYKTKLFKNADQKLCFLGCGYSKNDYSASNPSVIYYEATPHTDNSSIESDAKADSYICCLGFSDSKGIYGYKLFTELIKFPVILKCILNASQIDRGGSIVTYHMKHVNLLSAFQSYIYLDRYIEEIKTSFALEDQIVDALKRRYREQVKNKKKRYKK